MNKILKYTGFFLLNFLSSFNLALACIDSPQDVFRKSLISTAFILITLFVNIYIIWSNNKKNKSILRIIVSVLIFNVCIFIIWAIYSLFNYTFCV